MTASQKTMPDERDDRDAIVATFNRFASAMDRKDWESYAALFTEDATVNFTEQFPRSGRSNILKFVRNALEACGATHHMLSNYSVAINGDRATASCYFRAHHRGKGAKADLFEESLGIFSATLVRMDHGWRMSHLDETITIMLGTPDIFPENNE
ncbi:MAG: nuclear transport factor 2 family protein [Rhodospirillaceae bacterium]|nr:MAG: nuclear transport factor 2 family protein [Rhodospirillaceae bacterium]